MTSTKGGILLQNGTALIHDSGNNVRSTRTDILVQGGRITKIATNIEASNDVEVLDCTDKIISPGFIDTHHHGWQTQLKGRHANEQLLEYMVTGNAQSIQFSPLDVFHGYLAGMLEGIAAGTTTVVDHAHITCSPEHAQLAIAGMASSGVRGIYCYTPLMRIKHFNPLTYHPNPFEDWVMRTFHQLADHGPYGDGRITLGFAFDLFFLPADTVHEIFADVKKRGVKTITCHGTAILGAAVETNLHDLGLLDESIIISHGGDIPRENAEMIKRAGAHVSSTPSTELQMAMGRPYAFDDAFVDGGPSGSAIGLQDNASFGIDCHSATAGSIVAEAKLGLQSARHMFNEHFLRQGTVPRTVPESLSVQAAFNLATVKGAEAVRMQEEIGRIAEGFRADLVVFDALSPAMVAAAQHDPVAAVILHSSPADVETVLVDGVVRKRGGKLLPAVVDESAREAVGQQTLEWSAIAREIIRSRERIQGEIEKIDFVEAAEAMRRLFHVDESKHVAV